MAKAPAPAPPEGETVHRERRFELRLCAVPLRGGAREHRGLVVHPGSVVVLPLTDDGRLVMIRNHRWQIGETLLELPAGTRDPGETPVECAARELQEETGYAASHLERGAPFYAAPGLATEVMFPFVARGLTDVGQRLEPDERIQVVLLTLAEARAKLLAGEIVDAKTIAVLGRHLLSAR